MLNVCVTSWGVWLCGGVDEGGIGSEREREEDKEEEEKEEE